MLVTDGPFAETKEFIAGFDLLECADLDEAIEVAAKCPVSWFQTLEIRPFMDGLRLGEEAFAFGRGEDDARQPVPADHVDGRNAAAPLDDEAVMQEGEAWRQDLESRGLQILGNALEGTDTARTVRVRGGETLLSDGPFIETKEFIAGIHVVSCANRAAGDRARGGAIRSPGTTLLRCARSMGNDHARRSARARRSRTHRSG